MHKLVNNIFKISAAILIIALIIIISFTALCGIFPSKHTDLIHRYCNEYDVDPYLVLSLIKAESNFKTDAVSTADAKGLMQLTQETFEHCMQSLGKSFSDEDIFNPEKVNELYPQEATEEGKDPAKLLDASKITVLSTENARLRDFLQLYVVPVLLVTVVILAYYAILYRKLGVAKVLLKSVYVTSLIYISGSLIRNQKVKAQEELTKK